MAKNTSISLGDHFEKFINSRIKSGHYGSASEVIRTALRMLEAEEKKASAIREALIVGEKSGYVKDFDPQAHLKAWKSKRKK